MTSMKVIGKFNYIVLIYMIILPNCNLPCRWRIQQSRESSSAESKRGWKVSFQCLFYLKKKLMPFLIFSRSMFNAIFSREGPLLLAWSCVWGAVPHLHYQLLFHHHLSSSYLLFLPNCYHHDFHDLHDL